MSVQVFLSVSQVRDFFAVFRVCFALDLVLQPRVSSGLAGKLLNWGAGVFLCGFSFLFLRRLVCLRHFLVKIWNS